MRDALDLPLAPADVLLVVPPWADLNRPSIAVHQLQSIAAEDGFRVEVLYANAVLAGTIGMRMYQTFAYAPQLALLGEGIFSSTAYGLPSLTERSRPIVERVVRQTAEKMKVDLTLQTIVEMERILDEWVERLADAIVRYRFPIVGCTSTFEQTSASVAILARIKAKQPGVLTILGGANCEREMADGVASLRAPIDFIFSGESEATFRTFLREWRAGILPQQTIVRGKPIANLDELPSSRYSEYYRDRAAFSPIDPAEAANVWLSYETSRGCWWGEKSHCTFCGLNGETMATRQKSAERVLSDLTALLSDHPSRSVWMVDNIMPQSYFKDLLPRIAKELPGLHIYWDQKSNLTLTKLRLLKDAGISVIQPGVEALSTSLLKRMAKGVTTAQNIAMLRYARAVDLATTWNILFAFPGDAPADYDEQTAMMPLLHHLDPPTWLARINIDRFSPYWERPGEYGLRNLRPHPSYVYTFPRTADVDRIAYHFVADYDTAAETESDTLRRLSDAFDAWRARWHAPESPPPALAVMRLDDETFLLFDTRALPGTDRVSTLDRQRARTALVGGPIGKIDPALLSWAVEAKLGVVADQRYVPLATADPDLLAALESGAP